MITVYWVVLQLLFTFPLLFLTRINRNQLSFTAENHERNEKHERRNHHSFNGKLKATASTDLLYFEGIEPRINVNFRELFPGNFSFLCVAGVPGKFVCSF